MCKLFQDAFYVYETRDFWLSMGISKVITERYFQDIFGDSEQHIRDIRDAIEYLTSILTTVQQKLKDYVERKNTKIATDEIYRIFDKCFSLYLKEKADRQKLVEQNIANEEIYESFGHNRNIELHVLAASNVWIENCILLQKNIDKAYETNDNNIDPFLLMDLYVYGAASTAISMLALSRNVEGFQLFCGLDIFPKASEPIMVFREHPVLYNNHLLVGNQKIFAVSKEEYLHANSSSFGEGFFKEYEVPFLESMRVFSTFQKYKLKDGKYAFAKMTKDQFDRDFDLYVNGVVDKEKFWKAFVLTNEKLQSSKRRDDPIIWKMGTNKERHELRPIICFNDGTVYISYEALEQAKQIWLSYFANGGIAYTNAKDDFTDAEGLRCKELADTLVRIIKEHLCKKYNATFVETDVDYQRIFGKKEEDYGDYDIIFFTKDTNELFLIEAKYFSDSLNISGLINDYEKMYGTKGYYHHCRKRYDLVLSEPLSIKKYVGADDVGVKTHMLFISSKPLEVDFQDSEGIVTIIPLCIFDKYLDGKLISEDGREVMRPTIEL